MDFRSWVYFIERRIFVIYAWKKKDPAIKLLDFRRRVERVEGVVDEGLFTQLYLNAETRRYCVKNQARSDKFLSLRKKEKTGSKSALSRIALDLVQGYFFHSVCNGILDHIEFHFYTMYRLTKAIFVEQQHLLSYKF